MSSLASLLPQPKYEVSHAAPKAEKRQLKKVFEPPSYRKRKGFVPLEVEDYGDGGAFPEIHSVQYPLYMGSKDKRAEKGVVSLEVDANGAVKYDKILRQGMRKDVVMYSKYQDLLEKDAAAHDLTRPSAEEASKTAEDTAAAIAKLVDNKISTAQPTHVKKDRSMEPTFIRYTPSDTGSQHNSGAKQRILRVQEMPVDPLEPPKFRHKKVPNYGGSPPVPVMHSPQRKLTAEDQQNWKIPPCISNWKNIKGYTIALDKRMAADGRGLQEVQVNEKFAGLSQSLYVAEQMARKDIEERNKMQVEIARRKKKAKEEELRLLAAQRRQQVNSMTEREPEDEDESGDADDRDYREELRREKQREIRREYRMEQRKGDERAKSGRVRLEEERDVSEKIALGQQVSTSSDSMFDQRLFNQSEGMGDGFKGDESYDVYDKPLFKDKSANYIYRPKSNAADLEEEPTESDDKVTKILEKSTSKFKPSRGFEGAGSGSSSRAGRSKPVEFEKDEVDPFGIDEFMGASSSASSSSGKRKSTLDAIGKQGHMASVGGASKGAEYSRKHGNEREIKFTEVKRHKS